MRDSPNLVVAVVLIIIFFITFLQQCSFVLQIQSFLLLPSILEKNRPISEVMGYIRIQLCQPCTHGDIASLVLVFPFRQESHHQNLQSITMSRDHCFYSSSDNILGPYPNVFNVTMIYGYLILI